MKLYILKHSRAIVAAILYISFLLTLVSPMRYAKASSVGLRKDVSFDQTTKDLPSPENDRQGARSVFEKNVGQFDSRVEFLSRSSGSSLFLTKNEAVYVIPVPREHDETKGKDLLIQDQIGLPPQKTSQFFALRMKLVGSNPEPGVRGETVQEQRTNYFRGSSTADWKTNVPSYGEAWFDDVYEGVSMVWRGREEGATQYDFVVQPGANVEKISVAFEGADSLEIDKSGDLLIHTPVGTIRQAKPFTYQEDGDLHRTEVESSFQLDGTRVKFAVADYDSSRPLVIDPTITLNNLAFSTFVGSFQDDIINDIAVDSNGNTYVTGNTISPTFPTTSGTFDTTANGFEDVFVTKFNTSGTGIIFSTYLGGSFTDAGRGIAIDGLGNIFLTGFASSSFPVTAGAFDETFNGGSDVFVSKLSANGASLIYSTYIGASQNESANDIAIDGSGNAYIAVRTSDAIVDYPTTPGAFDTTFNGFDDAAVTKINPTGTALVYSTFIGGSSLDSANSIVVNSLGQVYVGGVTTDDVTDFPTTLGSYDTTANGLTDFFITKFSADGSSLVYSTFIGGTGIDNANCLAIDASGRAYIAGSASPGFPTTAGVVDTTALGSNEIGVSRLSADGSTLQYSTFIGGTQDESASGIAVDQFGNAYITGNNFGGDFPTTAGAYDTTFNGNNDAFLTVLNPAATGFVYSTYLGGGGHEFAEEIALDAVGNVYLAGRSQLNATPFPTTPEAYQTTNAGGYDGFVAKFGDISISGRVIDATGTPISNVLVAMSGQVSDFVVTGSDGRFGFLNTVPGEPHSVTATRSGYTFNPSVFNITSLANNRELTFVGVVGSPTGGSGGTLGFESFSTSKSENGVSVTLNVTRTGTISDPNPVTVDFTTEDGTSHAIEDYQASSGVLTFNPFETQKSITIPLTNDPALEPKETFRVILSNPTNFAEIDPNKQTTTVTILDDDLSAGDLLISEFRLRGRNGANDEYIKLFNPNDFDVTVNAADDSSGYAIACVKNDTIDTVASIPNLVTIPSRGSYMITNNNPSGGFSIIDYPTGRGTTTLVGDRTFSADIPDNADIVLIRSTNVSAFEPQNAVDAVGFGQSEWTSEGMALPRMSPENSEFGYVRRLTPSGLQDTGNNRVDFVLVDGVGRTFAGALDGKVMSTLGSPAPETTESLPMMKPSEVSVIEVLSPVWDPIPVPNGRYGTFTVYRMITNNTSTPIYSLRIRAIDFPTLGSLSQMRTSARPDFRLMSSLNEASDVKGTTLAAERLQPAGGGLNSTLTVDAISATSPLLPGQSIVVAIKFGVVRYGRFSFDAAIEALR